MTDHILMAVVCSTGDGGRRTRRDDRERQALVPQAHPTGVRPGIVRRCAL
jgi:hypothetical protein